MTRGEIAKYLGGCAHVHTRKSNFLGHWESNLTLRWILQALRKNGLAGDGGLFQCIVMSEHVSNPAKPKRLSWHNQRISMLLFRDSRTVDEGTLVMHGHEVSLLEPEGIDMPPRLAKLSAVVIASRHWLSRTHEKDPHAITHMLIAACDNPRVNIIGHPTRNIEDVGGVKWEQIFARAAATGTAIEINLNIFPDEHDESERYAYWKKWLAMLAKSGAPVAIGMDWHTRAQIEAFILEWEEAADGKGRLSAMFEMIHRAGITPDKVVTANKRQLIKWIDLDKRTR